MSTESHWTFNRGRGGSVRSDGISFNPALEWDGDVDDPPICPESWPIELGPLGEEWYWEVRFPGKTKYEVINPSKEGVYTPREVQAWVDRKYPLADVDSVSGETDTVSFTACSDFNWESTGVQVLASQLAFDWGHGKNQLLLDFSEGRGRQREGGDK